MTDLVDFAKRIENRLADASQEPHWTSEEAERYMAAVGERRERFEKIASRLKSLVIQPRLQAFASSFSNATLMENEPAGYCSCWLGYCERFPSSTKLAFTVAHDVSLESVSVGYDALMVPVFVKFNEHDKLTLSLGQVDDGTVAEWVERRLLEFLDAYLRIDRGGEDFDADTVVDPVCGMRISRSSATASAQHLGHPYYFCSVDCESKFSRDPTAYVQVKTM